MSEQNLQKQKDLRESYATKNKKKESKPIPNGAGGADRGTKRRADERAEKVGDGLHLF